MNAVSFIEEINNSKLKEPITVFIDTEEDYSTLATTPAFPLYGIGDDVTEAINMLKSEIISLRDDLNRETHLNETWQRIKDNLNNLFIITDPNQL